MKTQQLVQTENVINANKVLKNLLNRTRTEVVGLGLFYGKTGFGKSRWGLKTAFNNGFIYHRLEQNIMLKDFMRDLLAKLLHHTNSDIEVKGTKNEIYNQILDILQSDQNITIIVDEVDYAFQNKYILPTIRDWVDQSLATFVLIGMDKTKDRLQRTIPHFFNRTTSIYEFTPLCFDDTEKIFKMLSEVDLDTETIKFVHSKCGGTFRIIIKYLEAIEKIAKRLKKDELLFDDIKDVISKVES